MWRTWTNSLHNDLRVFSHLKCISVILDLKRHSKCHVKYLFVELTRTLFCLMIQIYELWCVNAFSPSLNRRVASIIEHFRKLSSSLLWFQFMISSLLLSWPFSSYRLRKYWKLFLSSLSIPNGLLEEEKNPWKKMQEKIRFLFHSAEF